MRRARAALQLCAGLCVACASATPDSTRESPPSPAPAQQVPAAPLPLGLTCDQCMAFDEMRCREATSRPIIAVVRGIERFDSHTDCQVLSDDANQPRACSAQQVVRFEHLRFLRNRRDARTRDTFAVFHDYYDYYRSGGPKRLPAKDARGVLLLPETTYLVFVGDYRQNEDLPADWHVSAACEIPDETQIGELP